MNIVHVLEERVAASGNQPAILDNTRASPRTLTFSALQASARGIAAQLRQAGLRPGDVVLLLQPPTAELYTLFVGILQSGLVAAFMDPSAGLDHIRQCCAIHQPRALIACARAHLLRLVSPALRNIPTAFSTDFPVPGARLIHQHAQGPGQSRIEDCPSRHPAIIRFTSGSTGVPKPSVRSHGFLHEQLRVIQRSFALTPGELDLVTMPMFVLSNLAAGVTSLLPRANLRSPGSIPPEAILRDLETHRPCRIGAAPVLLDNLARHCLRHSIRIDCLRRILTGGAPVFPPLLKRLHAIAPAADIIAVYGSTEAEPIALLHHSQIAPSDWDRMASGHGLLAGAIDPEIRLRILPEEDPDATPDVPCPNGTPGRIVVAGPHVNAGVVAEEAGHTATSTRANSEWHGTGDSGLLDEQGRLWLLGRSAARITDGFGTVYPFQVECTALEFPGVRRAALVSCDRRRILAVEPQGALDMPALQASLSKAHVDAIRILPRLPVDKRHNSKIDYPALHRILRRLDRD